MKWEGNRESDTVEDARAGGGGRGLPIGGRGVGLGTIAIALVAGWVFGINPLTVLGLLSGGGPAPVQQQAPAGKPPADDQMARFVSTVLADTEDVWREQFRQMGKTYRDPTLVLFSNQVESACGFASAAVGPFYCPGDAKVYLDLSFFDQLRRQFRAPGEFAQAYVIAHEVGHHVQNLLGISEKVSAMRGRVSQSQYNQLSVRLELQADFLAGLCAHHAQRSRQILEAGDVESALRAASAIGDDRLQRESQGRVVPDSFTHGTSEQRVRWFRRGLQSGRFSDGDTFNTDEL